MNSPSDAMFSSMVHKVFLTVELIVTFIKLLKSTKRTIESQSHLKVGKNKKKEELWWEPAGVTEQQEKKII